MIMFRSYKNWKEICETPENPRFWIKGKIEISVENPKIF